jgi:hypothetical protein
VPRREEQRRQRPTPGTEPHTCRAAELSSIGTTQFEAKLDDLARRHVAATISALTRRLRASRLRFIAAKSIFSRAAKCSSQRDLLGLIRCLLSIVINKL